MDQLINKINEFGKLIAQKAYTLFTSSLSTRISGAILAQEVIGLYFLQVC